MIRRTEINEAIRRGVARVAASALALLLALAFASSSSAAVLEDNVRFSRLNLDQGLSQSTINCIVQDRQGMIWFGTQDGLNRFDGYKFTVFKHDPLEPGSLSHNFIWALHLSQDGTLWIGTEGGGLERWNPIDDSFTHHRHDPEDPHSLGHDIVRTIAQDRDGLLWIGTEGGLDRFNPTSGRFSHFRHDEDEPQSLSHDHVRSVSVDSRGTIWVGTEGGGLNRWVKESRSFVHYRHDPEDDGSLGNDSVRTIREDPRGSLWIGTYEGGISRLDPETGRFTRYTHEPESRSSLSHNRVRALFSDSQGTMWVGTDKGLNRWLPDLEGFVAYRHNPSDPYSLSDDRVLSIYQDRGGLLWIATQTGLNRWNPTLGSFSHYKQDSSAETTLGSNIVTSMVEDRRHRVWIGTFGGLDLLDRETGRFTHFLHDSDDPGSLSDNRVMSLLQDSRGELWVGTLAGGLNRMSGPDGRFRVYRNDPEDPASLSANGVTAIHEDAEGTLWVGTYRGGLNRFDRKSGLFRRYRHDPADPDSLSRDRVMSLTSDRDGMLWIGTAGGGLNRLDPRTGEIHRFRHDPANPGSLSSDVIWAIHEDRDGVLWIGTQGGGLNRWGPSQRRALDGTFRVYTERDGLPNALIYAILEDGDGNLWLSSNMGLSKFDPGTEAFVNYDTTHGLQSNEFNFGAAHRNSHGEMYFGGNNGFNLFHPSRIHQNAHVPPVVLTGIYKLNERVALDRTIWDLERLELGHRDHVVAFDFAALDFTAPRKNRYAYKLEGFDEDWIDLGDMRRATYTNLDPGQYVFRVKGSNNDGLWNERGVSLAVHVLPPPWKTWWAYTLYALAVVGMIGGYVRVQARKLHREEEYSRQLELQVQERTQEIAERNLDLAEANQKLEQASLTDPLTGRRNRRYLLSYLQEDIARVERENEKKQRDGQSLHADVADFMFLMIDLDGFKNVNDTHGHEAGDRVLINVCAALEDCCRKSDTLIRWGGDEFLVVGRDVTRDAAELLAERIRSAVAGLRTDVGSGNTAEIGCSLGYAFYPFIPSRPAAVPWMKVLAVADRALYVAKESGRGAWVGITSAGDGDAAEVIRRALESPEEAAREGAVILRHSGAHSGAKIVDADLVSSSVREK